MKWTQSKRWIEEKQPWKAELVHEVVLEGASGYILASKDSPVPGIVTHYRYKKIGMNNVCMCRFFPDVTPDKCWEFSRKWLKRVEDQ